MFPTLFNTTAQLKKLIDDYFTQIEGEYHEIEKPGKEGKTSSVTVERVWDREPEPPTLCGLIHSLGFNSRQRFDSHCIEGEFADMLSRARLTIEACYEKKLHGQSAAGAIFALKNLGWNDKPDPLKDIESSKTLKVKLYVAGPILAANEKQVEQ